MKRASKIPHNASTGVIRIIAGKWRGRRLKVPNQPGLRPTTDRVRETLFNWLMHDVVDANCLDMFAGTGSLGLEALSRGAAYCTFIELSSVAITGLKGNVSQLNANAQVLAGEALSCLQHCQRQYQLVFLDPPFHQALLAPAITALVNSSLLAEHACVYIEMAQDETLPELPSCWQLRREKQYGQVKSLLFDISP